MSAAQQRGMGRGLAAILSVSGDGAADADDLRMLPLDLISPGAHQPRRVFDEAALEALAGSLRERGVLQPVLVRPVVGGTYELVAGERRWRAAQLAGLESIPALVRARDDAESLEAALIENMAREDVGLRVGRSRVAVSNLMRLLDLPDEAIELIERGELTEGHGRALARTTVAEGWSVRALEARARAANESASTRPHPGRPGSTGTPHPDQLAAAARITDELGSALGVEVTVRPRGGGYRVELLFGDPDEALALARRLRPRAVA